MSYPELAVEILSLFIDDIPRADLKAICEKTYTAQIFETHEIVPVRQLETGVYVLELSNGPTRAFKDIRPAEAREAALRKFRRSLEAG